VKQNVSFPIILITAVIYIGIGVWIMVWIRTDNQFRMSEMVDILAYGSIILWPITALMWLSMRPPEQLDDLGAKKSYQDFKNFMRSRRGLDTDLLSSIDKYAKKTTGTDPYEITTAQPEFRDFHLEELIQKKEWMEALRTANDMLRFAREQQEETRVTAYEVYIKEIKDKRRSDNI
jgi:uncharacterized membrane protein YciS (DUF1049 family)